jgi:hypothetical protein
LPAKAARVVDLLNGRVVAEGATEFPLTLEANDAILLSLE